MDRQWFSIIYLSLQRIGDRHPHKLLQDHFAAMDLD
jgi:hypothetical protein